MKPTIIEIIEQDKNIRKSKKEEMDKIIALSADFNSISKSVRLIDEGAFMMSTGEIDFIIKRGAVKKFYEALEDDYVGYINFAHMDLNKSPLYLGTWSKADLRLIEKEDGRYGLDVIPHFWEELSIVKDLLFMQANGIPLSISAEMSVLIDEESTNMFSEQANKHIEVYDALFIKGFSVVGNPRNADSTITLNKGDENMTLKDLLNKISPSVDEEKGLSVEEENSESTETEEIEASAEEPQNEETNINTSEEIEASADDSEDIEKIDMLFAQLKQSNEEKDAKIKELEKELSELKQENKKLNTRIDTNFKRLEQLVNNSTESKKTSEKDSVWG